MAEARVDLPGDAGLTAGWHLRMIGQLARGTFVMALCADAGMAWALHYATGWPLTLGWFALSAGGKVARAVFVWRLEKTPEVPVRELVPKLAFYFFLVGFTQCGAVLLARWSGDVQALYVVTMILVCLSATGVGSAVGIVPAYLGWVVPVTTAIIVAWLLTDNPMSRIFGVLAFLLPVVMTLYVRDYGRVLNRQQQLLDSLRIERDRAESAVAAKRQFFAAASHDLRQPLGVLRWYGDAVQAHARQLDHAALQSAGEGIARAVDHAEPLVRRYLEIAQFEAGAVQVRVQAVDLARMLEHVHDAFAHQARDSALWFRLELLSPRDALMVRSDDSMLRSVLDNIVGNALKFTREGGVTLTAERLDGAAGTQVRVVVRDTGIGISLAEQAHVFDDFYQVANTERSRSKGVGLGLAIARRQMLLLNIACHLQSAAGEGSAFELEVPAAGTEVTVDGAAPSSLAAPAGTVAPVRVLVVDDEPDVRKALAVMLEAVAWPVRTASGLADALGVLRGGFSPQALVLDYRLQGQATGQSVLAELRAAGCRAPAVFVTGDTAPERLKEMAAVGVPVLHKPVQGERLMRVIVEQVRGGDQ